MANCIYQRCKAPVCYRVERKWIKGEDRFVHTCYDHIPGSKTGASREELERGNDWYGVEKIEA